jgi:hypothetical protein
MPAALDIPVFSFPFVLRCVFVHQGVERPLVVPTALRGRTPHAGRNHRPRLDPLCRTQGPRPRPGHAVVLAEVNQGRGNGHLSRFRTRGDDARLLGWGSRMSGGGSRQGDEYGASFKRASTGPRRSRGGGRGQGRGVVLGRRGPRRDDQDFPLHGGRQSGWSKGLLHLRSHLRGGTLKGKKCISSDDEFFCEIR